MRIADLLRFRNRNRLSGLRRRTVAPSIPSAVENLEKRALLSASGSGLPEQVEGTDQFDLIEVLPVVDPDPTVDTSSMALIRISTFTDINRFDQVGATVEITVDTTNGLEVEAGDSADLIVINSSFRDGTCVLVDGGGGVDIVQVNGSNGDATYEPGTLGDGTVTGQNGMMIEFESAEVLWAFDYTTLNMITPEGSDVITVGKAADNVLTRIAGTSMTVEITPVEFFDIQNIQLDLGANDTAESQHDWFETIGQGLDGSGAEVFTVKGGIGNDRFLIDPSPGTEINTVGDAPFSGTGDRLTVEFAGVLNYTLPRNVSEGSITSTSHAAVNFEGMESVKSTAVTVLSPSSGLVEMRRPTFRWTSGENATAYEIWVANLELGKRVLHETNLTSTTWAADDDLALGRHRVWVRSIIRGEPSAWSAPVDFRVTFQPVGSFLFELPAVVDAKYGLTAAGDELNNWGSRNEKWLLGRDGDWFYITPDGSVFEWDGVQVTPEQPLVNGQLIARLSSSFYDNPLLFNTADQAEPVDGFGLLDSTPTLVLDADGARKYEVWISSSTTQTSETFTVTKDDTLRDLQLFTIPDADALPLGNYRYSVRAFDAKLNPTEWSEVRTFRIVTPPEIVRPTIPSIETRTTFEWTEVFGANRYELAVDHIAPDGTVTRVIHETSLVTTSYQVTEPLPGGTYQFSVRAWNDGVGTPGRSLWSETATFMTGDDIKPRVTGPTQLVNALRPTITWDPLDGVARYEVWITESNGSEPLIQDGRVYTNSYTTQMALPAGKYFVWVRAISTRGELTDWSEPFVFETNGGTPQVTGPIGTTSDFLPRFTWTPVDDAATYDLFIRRIGSGGGQEITVSGIDTNGFTPVAPLDNGSYRVWVRALNADGEKSDWSEGSNFSIAENDTKGRSDDSSDDLLANGAVMMASLEANAEFAVEEEHRGPEAEQIEPIVLEPAEPDTDEAAVLMSETEAPEAAVAVDEADEAAIDAIATEWPKLQWWHVT